jgi:hypothetical protein
MLDGKVYVRVEKYSVACESGDWLIRGENGELYALKDEFFQAHYVPVVEAKNGNGAKEDEQASSHGDDAEG